MLTCRSATSYNEFEVKQMIVFLGNMVNNTIDIEVSRLVIGFLKFCIVQTSAVPLHHTQFYVAYGTPTCRKLLYVCIGPLKLRLYCFSYSTRWMV